MKMAPVLILGLLVFTTSAWSADRKFAAVANSFGALSKVIDNHTQVTGVNEKARKLTPSAERLGQNLENDLETCVTTELSAPQIVKIEKDGVSTEFKNYHIRMEGPNCPMEMETIMDTQQTNAEEIIGDFSAHIILKQPDMIKKYNVVEAKIQGHIVTRIKQVGNMLKTYVEIAMTGSGESTVIGKFSQDMKFIFSFDMDPMTFDMSILTENSGSIKYNGVDNKIYGMTKMSGFGGMGGMEKKYTYNGADISETDFQIYSEGFILPGMVEEEDPAAPGTHVLTQCEYAVYEKNKVNADDLRTLMTQGVSSKITPVTSGKTCGQDSKQNFSYNGKSYSQDLKFDKEWINYSADFLTGPEHTSLFLIYQDEVPQTTESDEFTIGLQCKPVQVCH
jgi:hypothetical protein